jgi:DNA-binding transcriptional MerR regulator
MRYTISEMASLLGVTTHTLRYYEKMGLIHPEVNEDTGYRYYTVTDTRRFNLCRELRAAELSLEECRELIGAPTVEQSDAMFNHQIAQLRRRQVLDELAIRFLEHKREQYRTLEQNAGRIWVQNFPEMWRLTFSQEEAADRDKELQQEKAEWLECMPATRWAGARSALSTLLRPVCSAVTVPSPSTTTISGIWASNLPPIIE